MGNTLAKLRAIPHHPQFVAMSSFLQAIIDVLERQYSKYFTLEISEKLWEETASVRCHNIDSEEIMRMISASQTRHRMPLSVFYLPRCEPVRTRRWIIWMDFRMKGGTWYLRRLYDWDECRQTGGGRLKKNYGWS